MYIRKAPPAPLILIALFFSSYATLESYSVLSHEAIIDTVWDPVIKPILVKGFVSPSEEQLLEAHAYAYGGAVIQDMGYYPFGNRFFSDLTHYVRTGDFVQALLRESHDMYEYAFALGALEHYAADTYGHPLGVNRAVPEMYPKLREKYGRYVTYAQDHRAHVLVEFSFDVAQVAGAGYLPETYHNFIGFKVAKPLLGRAFQATYGIELKDLFLSEDLAIGTYRRAASEVIPRMTQIAWRDKSSEIVKLAPTTTRRKFEYRLSRSNYEREWGRNYERSRSLFRRWGVEDAQLGVLARILIFLSEHLPRVGPLQTLKFKPPTPQTQAMFIDSFRATLDNYQALLSAVRDHRLTLENKDLDTGTPTRLGEYELADKTFARLLHMLAEGHFKISTAEFRNSILTFYDDSVSHPTPESEPGEWQKILQELDELRAAPAPAPAAAAAP